MNRKNLLTLTIAISAAIHSANADTILRRGNGSEPKGLDPHTSEGTSEANIKRDIFEGLTARGKDAAVIPGVAEKWDISADGKTYTFHLRDTTWSDGTPFTAHDVVYAWQRDIDPATGGKYSFLLYPVKNAKAIAEGDIKDPGQLGAKATDDHTLVVELEAATPYFLDMLTHVSTYPVPRHIIEKHGKNWTRPENIVGNGAFKMTAWQPNAHITLKKSDTYWDKNNVKLDQVIYYPTEDQNTELKRYRAGELDMTYEIPLDQIKWLRENLKDELKTGPLLGAYYYGFNLTRPPFKDNPKLREALTLAIDRDIITNKITGTGETPIYGIVPPGIAGYDNYRPAYAGLSQQERDERAKQLYAEAGYSKDKPLKVELLYNTSENHKKIAIAITAMWKKTLGVEAQLINQEWKVFLNTRQEKTSTEAFRAGWFGDYNDPNTFLELYLSKAGLNDSGYDSAKFDGLLQQASLEQNPAKRAALLKEAEQELIDSYAIAPIYSYVSKRLVKPYVKGYTPNIMDQYPSKHLSIEK
ncbi:peptide ABC transporter substrate-binding protein [uncultured Cardiobacterium sp.]|uniref:peptide ABC transporter substrate-binding protein n=1 Tax=uncultured Cardiobacterium sp. TaxID=417619 RepID=UPI00261DA493|nr:peptide ABC transporter substrate-binding protein [uncultured Cardiobacterium sp.]